MTGTQRHLRLHAPHAHPHSPFGDDRAGRKAEGFARFFGTPRRLRFSTQAAYAAPTIPLAQTRQADREKAHAEADPRHRAELAQTRIQLLRQDDDLTGRVAELARQIEALTRAIRATPVADPGPRIENPPDRTNG